MTTHVHIYMISNVRPIFLYEPLFLDIMILNILGPHDFSDVPFFFRISGYPGISLQIALQRAAFDRAAPLGGVADTCMHINTCVDVVVD